MRKAAAPEITQLSRDEKLELLDRLWESLGQDPEALPLTVSQSGEQDRRLDELEDNGPTGLTVRELLRTAEDEALAEVDRLAEKIARAWRSPKSALELLEEQRR